MLSRVADSLYWMSRYMERAENDARILDVNLQLLLDLGGEANAMDHWAPVIASLEETDTFDSLYETADEASVTEFLTLQRQNPNSIISCLTSPARTRAQRANRFRAKCGKRSTGFISSCRAKARADYSSRVRTSFLSRSSPARIFSKE